MKKLFLTLGLASIFMVACNNTPKQPEQTAEATKAVEQVVETVEQVAECPMQALKAEFANWETMADEAKVELVKKACDVFAQMDAKKAECEAQAKECCKEGKAECQKKCEEMKAQCEQMKAEWANFANLDLNAQKDLILKRLEGCGGEKKCCKGEEGKCCKGEQGKCQEKPAN